MGIRTGQQYLDALNARTVEIYVDGERVTSDVADHPAFRNTARTFANLYDLQHNPDLQGALTITSPTTGDPVSASFTVSG